MKQITFLAAALFSVAFLSAQTASPIEFKETKYSFGKIKQGVPASHIFEFKNTSDKPIVIESAVAGCGCTTPEYPKAAIPKGATEKIKVTYNAASMGGFNKDVTVKVANAPEPIVLKIDGEVTADAASVAVKDSDVKDKNMGENGKAKSKDIRVMKKSSVNR